MRDYQHASSSSSPFLLLECVILAVVFSAVLVLFPFFGRGCNESSVVEATCEKVQKRHGRTERHTHIHEARNQSVCALCLPHPRFLCHHFPFFSVFVPTEPISFAAVVVVTNKEKKQKKGTNSRRKYRLTHRHTRTYVRNEATARKRITPTTQGHWQTTVLAFSRKETTVCGY